MKHCLLYNTLHRHQIHQFRNRNKHYIIANSEPHFSKISCRIQDPKVQDQDSSQQDRDQDQDSNLQDRKTKTCKSESRDQDVGLENYNTGSNCVDFPQYIYCSTKTLGL